MLSSILIEIHCSTQPKNIFFTNQSVQSLSRVRLPVTPWTAAHQASLSIISSWSLLKLMSIELTMPSYHLILCHLLLLPSVFSSIRVFSNESVLHIRWPKYQNFRFSCPRDSQESSPTSQFKSIYSSMLSFLYCPDLISTNDYWKKKT